MGLKVLGKFAVLSLRIHQEVASVAFQLAILVNQRWLDDMKRGYDMREAQDVVLILSWR